MPRFVILEHDHPSRHWDLMLEDGPVLRTWRLAAFPQAGRTLAAEASFDHRPFYLDYEGPVSGDRGTVTRWDGGDMTWITREADRIRVRLVGKRGGWDILLVRKDEREWEASF
jgi:hypothetical protein